MAEVEKLDVVVTVETKPKKSDARLGRMLVNFRIFIANLEHVAAAIKTCSEVAANVLENYEGTSRNVPLSLRPLIENLNLIEERISQGVLDMKLEEPRFSVEATNADGRGTWRMVMRILLRIVGECNVQLSRLPVIPKNETARQNVSRRYTQSHVLPVLGANTEYLCVLVKIFPTLMMITLHPDAILESEAKKLLATFYTHPFWYNYDSYMTRFRNLFDTLKLSILNSYTKSNFFTRNWARGVNGIQAILTTNRVVSKQADDMGKEHANIKFVKALWNLAETGLPEKVISWMKPGIKKREYFRITLTPEMRAQHPAFADMTSVRILYLYHTGDNAIKIPKEWRTSAPYSGKDEAAKAMVASALKDVEREEATEASERRYSSDTLKKQLMEEYEDATGDETASQGSTASSKDKSKKDKTSEKEKKAKKDSKDKLQKLSKADSESLSPLRSHPRAAPSENDDGEEEKLTADQLFQELPLEPFMPQEEDALEIEPYRFTPGLSETASTSSASTSSTPIPFETQSLDGDRGKHKKKHKLSKHLPHLPQSHHHRHHAEEGHQTPGKHCEDEKISTDTEEMKMIADDDSEPLVDISDRADPAIHGHVDDVKRSRESEKKQGMLTTVVKEETRSKDDGSLVSSMISVTVSPMMASSSAPMIAKSSGPLVGGGVVGGGDDGDIEFVKEEKEVVKSPAPVENDNSDSSSALSLHEPPTAPTPFVTAISAPLPSVDQGLGSHSTGSAATPTSTPAAAEPSLSTSLVSAPSAVPEKEKDKDREEKKSKKEPKEKKEKEKVDPKEPRRTQSEAPRPSLMSARGVPSLDTGNYDVVLHFHGGGFVSGSPSSHESYLRTWANTTNAIIFSVDYSLGPDFKYPTGFNECFFFYHWLVSGNNSLGINPKKIILTGDSAGGNLAVAVALKAAESGIRIPDGLVVAYPALDCTKSATPSRLVFGNDILVPYYFLEVCLDGYVDSTSDPKMDFCLSPLAAPDELIAQLPDDTVFMVAGYDPLLDDTVRFVRRMDQLNKPYLFEVYDCPHGFWNFDALLQEAERAMYRAGNLIRCMLDPQYAKLWQIAEEKAKRQRDGQAYSFSVDAALKAYPDHTPATFAPYSQSEIIYHLSHQRKPKRKPSSGSSSDIGRSTPKPDMAPIRVQAADEE